MNKTFYLLFLFVFLVLLQAVLLNNIAFLGHINPYLYIAFVILFPLKEKRYLFLFLAFLLGFCVDIFSDSGGIHAFATLFIAYIRLFFIRLFFRKTTSEYVLFRIHQEPFGKVFNYVTSLVVIHHFLLFSLEHFSFSHIDMVLHNTFFSSIFTVSLYFMGTFIFRTKTT